MSVCVPLPYSLTMNAAATFHARWRTFPPSYALLLRWKHTLTTCSRVMSTGLLFSALFCPNVRGCIEKFVSLIVYLVCVVMYGRRANELKAIILILPIQGLLSHSLVHEGLTTELRG